MFKRKQDAKGFATAPYSSVPGCFGGIVLVLVAIWAVLNVTEVVKWIGAPFMILPDALGIVDRPSKDEVARVIGPQSSAHEVELTRTGAYNVFRNFWDDWGVEEGQVPSISIEGPDGRIDLEYDSRGPKLYDAPAGHGSVESRFEINEPGQYIVRYSRTTDDTGKRFDASLVPDYITGNEAAIRWAFIIQFALILTPIGVFVYFRKARPRWTQVKEAFKVQDQKRDSMDDFLHDLKKGGRK